MKTDSEIINDYLTKKQGGIVVTGDYFFIPVRITGLGYTWRVNDEATIKNLKTVTKLETEDLREQVEKVRELGGEPSEYIEYVKVNRDAATFTNLENYVGLPLTIDHPHDENDEKTLLNYETIKKNPIIGTIVKAYLQDDQVWGIAKIFDLDTLDALNEFASTSPAVISRNFEQGDELFEKPIRFNHLAFVRNGHWDQQGGSALDKSKVTVIDSDAVFTEDSMSEQQVGQRESISFIDKGDKMPKEEEKDLTLTEDESTEGIVAPAGAEVAEVAEDEVEELSDGVEEEVEQIKETEAKEGEMFQELANDHKKLKEDKQVDALKKEIDEMRNQIDELNEKLDAEKDEVIEVSDEDYEEVDNDEVEEIDNDEEVTDNDEVVAISDADDEEISDSEEEVEIKDEDEIDADEIAEETDEDVERAETLNEIRETADSVAGLVNIKVPVLDGKKLSSAAVKRVFMRKNFSYVDSKYDGLVLNADSTSAINRHFNSALIDEAFDATLKAIKREAASKKKPVYEKNWMQTSRSNVYVKPNF